MYGVPDLTQHGPRVPTTHPERGDLQVRIYTRGELSANRSVAVSAPGIGGTMQIVHLAPAGSIVRAGDLVVDFDPAEQRYNLDQAKSEIAGSRRGDCQARCRRESAGRDRSGCRAPCALRCAAGRARREWKRVRGIHQGPHQPSGSRRRQAVAVENPERHPHACRDQRRTGRRPSREASKGAARDAVRDAQHREPASDRSNRRARRHEAEPVGRRQFLLQRHVTARLSGGRHGPTGLGHCRYRGHRNHRSQSQSE